MALSHSPKAAGAAEDKDVGLDFIQSDNPQHYAYIERFNQTGI